MPAPVEARWAAVAFMSARVFWIGNSGAPDAVANVSNVCIRWTVRMAASTRIRVMSVPMSDRPSVSTTKQWAEIDCSGHSAVSVTPKRVSISAAARASGSAAGTARIRWVSVAIPLAGTRRQTGAGAGSPVCPARIRTVGPARRIRCRASASAQPPQPQGRPRVRRWRCRPRLRTAPTQASGPAAPERPEDFRRSGPERSGTGSLARRRRWSGSGTRHRTARTRLPPPGRRRRSFRPRP